MFIWPLAQPEELRRREKRYSFFFLSPHTDISVEAQTRLQWHMKPRDKLGRLSFVKEQVQISSSGLVQLSMLPCQRPSCLRYQSRFNPWAEQKVTWLLKPCLPRGEPSHWPEKELQNTHKNKTKKNNWNPKNKPDLVCIISLGYNAKSSIKMSPSGVLFIHRHLCCPWEMRGYEQAARGPGVRRASWSPWALLITAGQCLGVFVASVAFGLSW